MTNIIDNKLNKLLPRILPSAIDIWPIFIHEKARANSGRLVARAKNKVPIKFELNPKPPSGNGKAILPAINVKIIPQRIIIIINKINFM